MLLALLHQPHYCLLRSLTKPVTLPITSSSCSIDFLSLLPAVLLMTAWTLALNSAISGPSSVLAKGPLGSITLLSPVDILSNFSRRAPIFAMPATASGFDPFLFADSVRILEPLAAQIMSMVMAHVRKNIVMAD